MTYILQAASFSRSVLCLGSLSRVGVNKIFANVKVGKITVKDVAE